MEINANASVQVSPRGSQIAIFLLLLATIGFFGWACLLYVQERKFVLPLVGAAVFVILACILWFYSHRNESLSQSHPMKVDLGDGDKRLIISADSRSVPELSYLQGLLSHYHMTFFRSPLPMASGEVDASGEVVSGSGPAAVSASEALNASAQDLNCEAFDSALAIIRDNISHFDTPVVSEIDAEKPMDITNQLKS